MTKLGKIRGRARSSFVVFWHTSCERSRAAWTATRNWCFIRKLSYETRTGGHAFQLRNGIDAVLYRADNKKIGFMRKRIKKYDELIPHNKRSFEKNYVLQLNCGETPMYLLFSEYVSLDEFVQMTTHFPERNLYGICVLCDEQGGYQCNNGDGGEMLKTAMAQHVDLKVLNLLYSGYRRT